MIRNAAGITIFAVLAAVAFKMLAAFVGWLFGAILTLLFWALVAFAVYTVLKIFMPGTAAKVKSTINGDAASAP